VNIDPQKVGLQNHTAILRVKRLDTIAGARMRHRSMAYDAAICMSSRITPTLWPRFVGQLTQAVALPSAGSYTAIAIGFRKPILAERSGVASGAARMITREQKAGLRTQ
jgi:hypothetical protein